MLDQTAAADSCYALMRFTCHCGDAAVAATADTHIMRPPRGHYSLLSVPSPRRVLDTLITVYCISFTLANQMGFPCNRQLAVPLEAERSKAEVS